MTKRKSAQERFYARVRRNKIKGVPDEIAHLQHPRYDLMEVPLIRPKCLRPAIILPKSIYTDLRNRLMSLFPKGATTSVAMLLEKVGIKCKL